MIVAALLTAVGINLGLTLLYLVLFSLLRSNPALKASIYAPRVAAASSSFAPLAAIGWLDAVFRRSEADLAVAAGLDGLVFMRIFVLCLKIFSAATVVGLGVLLPINYYLGDQLRDASDLPNSSVDFFSISNVNDGSNILWVHFGAAYLITGLVCFFLFQEYKNVVDKRLEYFMKSEPLPQHFTILVRAIPSNNGSSISDTVEKFFNELYPSTYLSHSMITRTSELRRLIADSEATYKKLINLKESANTQQRKRGGFLFLYSIEDLIDHYQKKLDDLEDSVRLIQSTPQKRQEIPAAFVSFKTQYAATEAVNIRQANDPTVWLAEHAPEPRDVYWPFFSTSFFESWISKFVVVVSLVLLIIVSLTVSTFVQGLTYLEQLKKWFNFLNDILNIAVVSEIVTGYLPSFLLHSLASFVPLIMIKLSTMQGLASYSHIERSACVKMLWFTLWVLFVANVLTGSITSELQILSNPKDIPASLAVSVPAQAAFFIAYVVAAWSDISSQLTQTIPLLYYLLGLRCSFFKFDFKSQSIPYYSEIPRILFFGLLGITYVILAPLILPFILIFFGLAYMTYRNQLFNMYVPKYETAGKFWPIVHSTIIFSLVLMQIITIGIFGVKKLALASSLILPLPVLTLLFNDYCGKRFLPTFTSDSAQCLKSKDQQFRNDPAMTGFYAGLISAYSDPALSHRSRHQDGDGPMAALLPNTVV